MSLRISIPLGHGTLKIKSHDMLRSDERKRRVPVKRIGRTYLIWRSKSKPNDVGAHSAGGGPRGPDKSAPPHGR